MRDHGVVAPGYYILSLRIIPANITYWDVYDNYYASLGGTSMATPHVSGTVALLLQAARKNGTSLTPAQIRSILQNTSIDLGTAGKDDIYGAGRINVSAAVAPYAPSGQNTYVQFTNGSFGIILKGQTRNITSSLILNNTGDMPAKVEARFSSNVSGVFGMVNGTNVLNASNLALGNSTLVPLSNSGAEVQVGVASPGLTALTARLSVPVEQTAGEYSGTVILIFSNTI